MFFDSLKRFKRIIHLWIGLYWLCSVFDSPKRTRFNRAIC